MSFGQRRFLRALKALVAIFIAYSTFHSSELDLCRLLFNCSDQMTGQERRLETICWQNCLLVVAIFSTGLSDQSTEFNVSLSSAETSATGNHRSRYHSMKKDCGCLKVTNEKISGQWDLGEDLFLLVRRFCQDILASRCAIAAVF